MTIRVVDPNKEKETKSTMNVLQPGAGDTETTHTSATEAPTSAPQPQTSGSSIQSAPSPRQQQKPSSGTFTNLQQYSQANQGGGSRVAGAVQKNLQNQAKQGQAKLGTTEAEFKQKMDTASGQAATEQGRQQAIQNTRAFTEREAGINSQNSQSELPEDFNDQSFSDIINKQYTGIERADQTASYKDSRDIYRNLEQRLKQSQDPTQSASLLKSVYQQPGQQYSQGQRNLDSLFYDTSKEAQAIRSGETFRDLYKSPEQLSQLETGLSSQAQARKEAIQKMREDARGAFGDVSQLRTGQVSDRIGSVKDNWSNIENYFKDSLRDKTGNIDLSDFEAKTLGLGSGDQFFNLLKNENIDNFIKSTDFDRDRIVSKDEQSNLARLEALSNMGNLGYRNEFYNADRAGTQSALDSLDTENVRNKLNESMGNFKNVSDQQIQGQGVGHSSFDKFNWDPKNMGWQSQGVGASAQQQGKLADVLKQSGYDFTQAGGENVGSTDHLKKLAALDGDTVKGDLRDMFMNTDYLNQQLVGGVTNLDPQATLDSARNLVSDAGASLTNISDPISKTGDKLLGGATDKLDKITGLDVGGMLKSVYNPLSSIGGAAKMLTGSKADQRRAQAEAQMRAYEAANQDLKSKMQGKLTGEGFYNVANIAKTPNDAMSTRAEALRNILKGLDKTNV